MFAFQLLILALSLHRVAAFPVTPEPDARATKSVNVAAREVDAADRYRWWKHHRHYHNYEWHKRGDGNDKHDEDEANAGPLRLGSPAKPSNGKKGSTGGKPSKQTLSTASGLSKDIAATTTEGAANAASTRLLAPVVSARDVNTINEEEWWRRHRHYGWHKREVGAIKGKKAPPLGSTPSDAVVPLRSNAAIPLIPSNIRPKPYNSNATPTLPAPNQASAGNPFWDAIKAKAKAVAEAAAKAAAKAAVEAGAKELAGNNAAVTRSISEDLNVEAMDEEGEQDGVHEDN